MTISTTIIKNSFSGDGSTTAFTYSFPINSTSEITVIIKASTGVETVKTITTHYTVADAGANGGTVTFTSGNIPASGETVVLFRNTTKNQVTDLIENDPFLAESLEAQFDNLQMQVQEVSEAVDRSFKVAKTNAITTSSITTSAADRANKILSFDASGNVEATAFTNLDTLTEMTDVTLSSPADNEVLAYDSGTAHFINQTPAEASLVSLTGTETLTNKTLTSPVINTGVSGTAILDEDNLASDSATQLATQQSIKAYVDATVTAEDLDVSDGSSAIAIDLDSEVLGILGGTGLTSAASGNNVTLTVDAAQTGITSLLATDIKIGEDDQTKVDFETADTINFYAGNEKQLVLTDGALTPGTNAIVDLGTDALEFKDGYFDGTLEADAITIAGTALNTVIAGVTVTNATNAVNSTHVSVADNENTNEENLITFIEDASATGNVGLESDGDFAYNPSTGTVSATIFKGNIDAVDGDFDGTLEADAITVGGTNLTAIYSPIAGGSNIVTTGALNSGSITSGFGTIDTGSSTITTTGVISGGGFTAGNAVLAEAELELLDGLTAGTAIASKVVTTDASKDTTGQRNLTITGELDAATLDISGAIDVAGTANLDVVDIDGAVDMATTLTLAGNADFNGDLDVDGTTNLDVVDIDGAVNMATTALVTGVLTTTAATVFNGGFASNAASSIGGTTPTLTIGDGGAEDAKILFDGNAQNFHIGLDDSGDKLTIGLGNNLGTTPGFTMDENTNVIFPDNSVTIISSGNNDNLTLISTDTDANAGPNLHLYRNQGTDEGDDDVLGQIKFSGRNDNAQDVLFYRQDVQSSDVSDGAEDAQVRHLLMINGSETEFLRMNPTGFVLNEGGIDLDTRIESSGDANTFFLDGEVDRIYLGHNANTNINGLDARLQISGTSKDQSALSLSRYSADANPPSIAFAKSRNASIAGNTIVQSGDILGTIRFAGADGGDFGNAAAQIDAVVDGTPGVNDMPGRLVFSTAADGATGATERMRIQADGRTQFNLETMGSAVSTSNAGIDFVAGLNPSILMATNGTGNNSMLKFLNDNGEVGSIKTNGSATAFNTSSDYRLKENVVTDWDATTRLKQLKPSRFNFKADADTTVDGFLAHEVSSIVPEAINGDKDATETKTNVVVHANGDVIDEGITEAKWTAGKAADEDGNTQYPSNSTWEASKVVPVYQGIDQSKLVPLLVKTIQELEARITVLEG